MEKEEARIKSKILLNKTLSRGLKARVYGMDKRISNTLQKLLKILNFDKSKNILFYYPLKIEPNILTLIKRLRIEKYKIYLPKTNSKISGTTFTAVRLSLPLFRDAFGTYSPSYSMGREIRRLDLLIAPVLAVNPALARLGYGKGMYDRFYSKVKKDKNLKVIFLNRLNAILDFKSSTFDTRADICINDNKTIMKGKKYANHFHCNNRHLYGANHLFNRTKTL